APSPACSQAGTPRGRTRGAPHRRSALWPRRHGKARVAAGGGCHPDARQGPGRGAFETMSTPRRCPTLKRDEVMELFSRLRELNPRPTTELEYSTPFELLVAVT